MHAEVRPGFGFGVGVGVRQDHGEGHGKGKGEGNAGGICVRYRSRGCALQLWLSSSGNSNSNSNGNSNSVKQQQQQQQQQQRRLHGKSGLPAGDQTVLSLGLGGGEVVVQPLGHSSAQHGRGVSPSAVYSLHASLPTGVAGASRLVPAAAGVLVSQLLEKVSLLTSGGAATSSANATATAVSVEKKEEEEEEEEYMQVWVLVDAEQEALLVDLGIDSLRPASSCC